MEAPEILKQGPACVFESLHGRLAASEGFPKGNPDVEGGRIEQLKQQVFFVTEIEVDRSYGHLCRLGDVLDFDAGGLPLSGRVTSLRKVDWDSFRVNFFVVAPAGVLDALPRSHITSFYLPPARVGVLSGLVAAFPNVTVIDVEQVMGELRGLMQRVSGAVQTIFLFSLGTGLLVLLAALYARRDERAREIGIWRTLGASRATLRAALAAEFAVLGLLAGAVAAGAASLLAWVLATRVFDLPHAPDPWIWLAGLGGGVGLVLLAGWLATRDLLEQPPLKALRME